MHVPRPPTRQQVEEQFVALLDGREDRDSVDRWAARWWTDDDVDIIDEPIAWALELLCGIDLRHGGPVSPYLHSREQVVEWLDEFRRRCAGRPPPASLPGGGTLSGHDSMVNDDEQPRR